MLSLNENQLAERFLKLFESEAKKVFGLNLSIRRLQFSKPEPNELYKEYKDGNSSSLLTADFELLGWKSYSDDGLEGFCRSLLEKDENFYPIVELGVFEMSAKGKQSVKLEFNFVFTRHELVTAGEENSNDLDKREIIRQIELRLSEIYTFLSKLK